MGRGGRTGKHAWERVLTVCNRERDARLIARSHDDPAEPSRVDQSIAALLDELTRSARRTTLAMPTVWLGCATSSPPTGALLAVLVRALGARRILELGTSNGYSTIWLADAARDIDGTVTSVELDPQRTAMAQQNLTRRRTRRARHPPHADAGAVLAAAESDAHDFVLIDAERDAYLGYWPDLVRVLAPVGLLALDKAILIRTRWWPSRQQWRRTRESRMPSAQPVRERCSRSRVADAERRQARHARADSVAAYGAAVSAVLPCAPLAILKRRRLGALCERSKVRWAPRTAKGFRARPRESGVKAA